MISVRDLRVTFPVGRTVVEAVRGVDLDIAAGECVALVGESGSGKSVTARTLVGLAGRGATVSTSRFEIDGKDVRGYGERDWKRLRGSFAGLVLQDALVSLDPLRTVGAEIGEVLRIHKAPGDVVSLLSAVHVPEPSRRAKQYPHQLSGGLRQRALIASAIAAGPPLLIADEPTTALDVTVQAQILDLLAERRAAGETLLLISHDLAVVSRLADRVLVMKDGRVIESGDTASLLAAPAHPYTRELVRAVPSAASRGRRLSSTAVPDSVALDAEGPPEGAADSVVIRAEGLRKTYGRHTVVDGVDLVVRRGEIVGLVGESGSGKTTVAQLVFGLVPPTSGTVAFEGAPWTGLKERRRRPRRRRLQFISQDPLSAFDPRWTVRRIVGEALAGKSGAVPLLERVGLSADVLDRYPRQLSGGQRQRVAIARALAPRPSLIICDEPVSALDVSVQAQVLDLLADIRATDGTALLFISHDLGVVHHLADRVLVMRDGSVVESGPIDDVFHHPQHEYTRALLDAVPTLEVSQR
ncbi:ABC transporter ATP-binding protein [Paractinoplanes deccanensis]|uniref:ABC transporter ATP-binding protein n=1 Tax=Paractinoplanes deccanensis TaxID=113561 RepID=A0ABQ3Y4D3_9ACTN|nr:ABC transporter ATP-binding protein [Actinoplanes deccanensis]GID74843.1 ABC transporter ATP-binding protein [Actinoplanes deccanensis]